MSSTVKYGKFEMPQRIKKEDEKNEPQTFARFVAEPLERGFAHTIGNCLRRIMLTSLEAPSIISIRIEGVSHEFAAVDGVVEDMTHIILNLKGALFRYVPIEEENGTRENSTITKELDITQDMIDASGGNYKVTIKDLVGPSHFEIVNPDLHIFTATKPTKRRVDICIGIGKGYVSSERHSNIEPKRDEIILDSIFSPVRLVNYWVEKTRVGQDTDYDKLILDITTDGRITPEEAVTFSAQIAIEHLEIFNAMKMHKIAFDQEKEETNKDRDEMIKKLSLKINEIELSVRSTNCLSSANIDTIGELVVMPESEMLRFRNFGKKSLTEIKQKLEEMGLSLGMDLSRYGINRDNIKEVIKKYHEDQVENMQKWDIENILVN